jgi:hypothetical protein
VFNSQVTGAKPLQVQNNPDHFVNRAQIFAATAQAEQNAPDMFRADELGALEPSIDRL